MKNSECYLKILPYVVFIAQISHYEEFRALHKLILIALQLKNQSSEHFPRNNAVPRVFLKKITLGTRLAMNNHCLPYMYWLWKMYEALIQARFFVASPMSSIKLLAKAITSAFQLFYKQIKNYSGNYRFLTRVNTF